MEVDTEKTKKRKQRAENDKKDTEPTGEIRSAATPTGEPSPADRDFNDPKKARGDSRGDKEDPDDLFSPDNRPAFPSEEGNQGQGAARAKIKQRLDAIKKSLARMPQESATAKLLIGQGRLLTVAL